MHFGAFMFPTEYAIRIDELARALEERGFESLFLPEHTHIPVSRRTPFPSGGPLPKEYAHTLDPFVALTAAAAATTRLRLGTGICLLIHPRPPPLPTGRFWWGGGAGGNVEEMENQGTVFKPRFGLMRERVLAMKAIWT